MGFFDPVIQPQILGQSRNPEGYFRDPTSHAYFQFRISPSFCSKIPNPEPCLTQSRNPEVYFWDPASRAYFQSRISPYLCFEIPNPELQTREIPHPEPYLAQSRNPDGYFRNPASRAYFQFRTLLLFCYEIDILNAGKQIRQTPHLEEPFWESLGTILLDSKLRY